MNNARYEELTAKYLSGDITPPEKEELMAWVAADEEHKAFFDGLVQLWSLAENFDTPYETDINAAWKAVEQKLDTQQYVSLTTVTSKPTRKVTSLWVQVVRIAAVALVALVAVWWVFQHNSAENATLQVVQTTDGEQKEVVLPDGSSILLNENSLLSYDANFEPRRVQLEGEAFFDVERMVDSPFEVISGSTQTLVLGTSFNVRAYPTEEQIEVTVETGKVRFAERTKTEEEAVVLPAGTSGIYRKPSNELVKTETKLDNALAWKTQRLDFEDSPMSKVISDLERYFGIRIQVANESILSCPVTGDFQTPQLTNTLEAISFLLNDARFEQQTDGNYLLIGEGCE